MEIPRRIGPEPSLEPLSLRRLYVHDAEDVLELEPRELSIVWKHRHWLCGTPEAAAEVYAFLRFHNRLDEQYQGYLKYLHLPEVLHAGQVVEYIDYLEFDENEFLHNSPAVTEKYSNGITTDYLSVRWLSFAQGSLSHIANPLDATGGTIDVSVEIDTLDRASAKVDSNAAINDEFCVLEDDPQDTDLVFDVDDVEHMSLASLHRAWLSRQHSFSDLGAAATALARLRFENRSDSVRRPAMDYINHPLIQELCDYLPEEQRSYSPLIEFKDTTSKMFEDRRTSDVRRSIVREGQAGFRAQLIAAYGAKCVVTEANQVEVLQAAHILPYKGIHSNDIDNGLLLRADVHLLFDNYLLSIHPGSMRIEIAPSVIDDGYLKFHGKVIAFGRMRPNIRYIEMHYKRFRINNF